MGFRSVRSYLWITTQVKDRRLIRIALYLARGLKGRPMDICERCFFVAGMTCVFVLVGMGLLTLSL